MQNDTVTKTLTVAALLCIVCSILVSTAAVKLRPIQAENKALDVKKNLLLSAGLLENPKASKDEILERFSKIETQVIDLATGEVASDIDAETFDQKKAAKDPSKNFMIPRHEDIARIKRRSRYGKVYLIKDGGRVDQIVLPFHGKGLWSTMYGFLALSPDTTTIKGIGYYQHGETPGLGGEVDNPSWKAQWAGKKAFNAEFRPVIEVVKGRVNPKSKWVDHQVDGLSGATLTATGVQGMINFWLGKQGYGPYLAKLRTSGL
jgi:Na+-transporting NADH:ubiquinone oxidoreductase subunit C